MKYAIVHIADIHYRTNEPEGVSSVLKVFLEDFKEQKPVLSGYDIYIAITGDLVREGKDADAYLGFHKELNDRLNELGLTKEYRILVPGNHDINKEYVEKNFDNLNKFFDEKRNIETDFNNFFQNENEDDIRFENYKLFEADFAKHGLDFSTSGRGWQIDDNLGVYCLNSALCSLAGAREVSDQNRLAVYTRGLVEWCNTKVTKTNVILMHHPIDFLNEWSRNELKQIIEKISPFACAATPINKIYIGIGSLRNH